MGDRPIPKTIAKFTECILLTEALPATLLNVSILTSALIHGDSPCKVKVHATEKVVVERPQPQHHFAVLGDPILLVGNLD